SSDTYHYTLSLHDALPILLKKMGHEVITVANGKDALNHMAEQTFDLVLMDVQMPEMDGLEATRAIREQERSNGGHMTIVAMTARSEEHTSELQSPCNLVCR